MEDTKNASCERVLFVERDDVVAMLKRMAEPESLNVAEREDLLGKVTSALEKYLEQSHLLDPHLDVIMEIVMGRARELVMKREAEVIGASSPGEAFPFQLFKCSQLHSMFCVVYQLCRVRGSKAIVRLMPHEASELEPVIHALQAQDTDDYSTWQTRYGLLLWLSMLSLVPFDIDTIDSGKLDAAVGGPGMNGTASSGLGDAACHALPVPSVERRLEQSPGTDLVGTILSLGMKHLGDTGPTRDAAAACLSSLLTRPDMEACHLRQFLEWSAAVLERVTSEGREGQEGLNRLAFLVMGVMATLAALFKQGHREKLIDLIPLVFYPVVGLAQLGSGQSLLRKMLVKLLQRLGTTYLPTRVVSWRYCRGQRSLLQNLVSAPGASPALHGEGKAPPTQGKTNEGDGDDADVDVDDVDVDVPQELEDIIEALLCGLRDQDTVVRWSAAKGVGRITGRLPRDLADDVVCSVLDLFVEAEGDGAWHGGCLALAELARRGLLLPERLPRACPVVRRALAYDVRRGAGSVGSHVRDAACYVCWAFARAYSPQVLGPYLPGLCDSMLSAALLDREVNVRRAAAAAFQENVGRQGQYGDNAQGSGVAHGIDIITAADYFSLGNRQQAYLQITKTVATFVRYRHHLVDCLREDRLRHWDPEIRRLAALALHNMTELEPNYMADVVLPATLRDSLSPDLVTRHGACLATAEVTLALGKVPHALSRETLAGLVGVVPALEKARLYRGRGGELMRQAACRVVECLALIKADVAVKTQIRLLDSVDESLKHPVEAVQLAAVAALKAMLKNWFPVGNDGPSERLQTRVTKKYVSGLRTEENAAVARGYALALAVLPTKIAAASRDVLEDVLEALKDASRGQHRPRRLPSAFTTNGNVDTNGNVRTGDDAIGDTTNTSNTNGTQEQQHQEGGNGQQGQQPRGPSVGAIGGGGGCGPCGGGPGGEPDAETRRNAVRALISICEEIGVGDRRTGSARGIATANDDSGRIDNVGDGDDGDDDDGDDKVRAGSSEKGSRCHDGHRAGEDEEAQQQKNDRQESGGNNGDDDGGGSVVDDTEVCSVTRNTACSPRRRRWRPEGLTLTDVEGVLSALLSATEDYSTDKRGDVGSWCRIAALEALERLARLAARASAGLPMSNRGDEASLSPTELLRRPETDYARLAEDGFPVMVSTAFGDAMVEGSRAQGEVLEVRFVAPSLDSSHFPDGTALINKRDVTSGPAQTTAAEGASAAKKSTERFLLPRLQDRLALLERPPQQRAVSYSSRRQQLHPCDRVYFTPNMMERIVCSVLKQLSEKLDAVRERAGTVLQSLVQSRDPQLPFIPQRGALTHAIAGVGEMGAGESVNWASPAATFPIVVGLLAVPEYHDAIVAGLVVSVGGLSESVVKLSSSALLRWVRACKSSGNKRALAGLALRLVSMFGDAAGDARIVVPLLKTVEVLLSNDSFDFLTADGHPFAQALLSAVSKGVKGCRDVKKICLGASVFTCMLDYGEPVRPKALRSSIVFLGHRFPTVRKTTAEALYLKLLANEEVVHETVYDEVLDILTCTPWDGDIQRAKNARAKLGSLLHIQLPSAIKAGGDGGRGTQRSKVDEMESYENLVRTVGY